MPSVQAKAFSKAVGEAFASGGVIARTTLRKLQTAHAAIADPKERAAAGTLLSLVRHDRELDEIELKPARKAMATLLGISGEKLPAALEKVLRHAVPEPNVRVENYDLSFDFSKDGPTFPARAVITLEKKSGPVSVLEVDPERLAIQEVRVRGKPVRFEVNNHRLRVHAKSAAVLDIRYTVRPTDNVNGYGLIRDKFSGRMWTLTWPYNTGALFPSHSSPFDAATAKVTVKVAAGQDVIGTGVKRPVPAYAVALYTGPFSEQRSVTAKSGTKVVSHGIQKFVRPEVRAAYRKASADAIDWLGGWLGPYAFGDRLDLIEVKGDYGGMEHAGKVALMVGSIRGKADAEEVAVHETIHHWFGDNVRIKNWGEFWMSEGFTNYLTFRFFGQRDGQAALNSHYDEATRLVKGALRGKRPALVNPAWVDIHDTFTQIPYDLGAWLLRMLEGELGTKSFDPLLKAWYQSKKFTAASTAEFVEFIKQHTGRDMTQFFKSWGSIHTVPRFEDRSKIDGQRVTVKLRTTHPAPPGTTLPLVIEGRHGEKKTLRVDPSQPLTVEAGFPIKRLRWDPERWVLAEVV